MPVVDAHAHLFAPEQRDRRAVLADWMTKPDNPFFAKAMVNRTWAALFGSGFVNPIDDMHDGNVPSHPALLDAMARDFSRNGFDVKFLYKIILLSKAYQRTSKPAAGKAATAKPRRSRGRRTVTSRRSRHRRGSRRSSHRRRSRR